MADNAEQRSQNRLINLYLITLLQLCIHQIGSDTCGCKGRDCEGHGGNKDRRVGLPVPQNNPCQNNQREDHQRRGANTTDNPEFRMQFFSAVFLELFLHGRS